MVSASFSPGAGRTTPGTSPILTHAFHPYFYLRNARNRTFGSNSNRHLRRLECDVTSRKQTTGVRSNRQKIAQVESESSLRNTAHSTHTHAPEQSPCPPPFSSPSVICATFASAVAGSTPLTWLLTSPLTWPLTQPSTRPSISPSRPHTQFSNRNSNGLEIAVTPTKHSPNLSLINNKKELFRKIACRAGCLPTIKPAFSMQPRRRTAAHPTKSHPTNPATSNPQRKGLEIPVTRRKHSLRHKSNRNSRGT